MKKLLILTAIVGLSFSVFPQEEIFIKESLVVNVEVPVRVFKEGEFVDNITINDFEVFENGILQKIEAVYLVKKRSIERSEEKKRFFPKTSRTFFLFFEVAEHMPRIGEAVSYFIHNILVPGDNFIVVTPMQTYRLKDKAFEINLRAEIANELMKLLRKDALTGNSEYRAAIHDLKVITKSLSAALGSGALGGLRGRQDVLPKALDSTDAGQFEGMELDEILILYEALFQKLETLRKVDQLKLMDFAKFLKNKEGQKYVFMFYQREFIPQVESRILNQFMSLYQHRPDILMTISRLVGFHQRSISFDVDSVKQAYADSSVSIHFLFVAKPKPIIPEVHMQEHSEDIFVAFSEMAKATGGFADSSSNPVALFQKALEASENYYLLYYSPKSYEADGRFKNIKVRVKNKNFRVSHRAGYFAN